MPNLKQLLQEKGISQKEFAQKIEYREATISEMCNDLVKQYRKDLLEKIVNELDIKDMNEVFKIVEVEVDIKNKDRS